jgi:hypothetical protein
LPVLVQGDARPTRTGADVEHATLGQFEGRVGFGREVPRCVRCREEAVRPFDQFVCDAGGSARLLAGEKYLAEGIADRQLLVVAPHVLHSKTMAASCHCGNRIRKGRAASEPRRGRRLRSPG